MQTHRDDDVPGEVLRQFSDVFGDSRNKTVEQAKLEQRAREMVANGESQITAGSSGERVVGELQTAHAFVRQLPDDPDCIRVSIGEVRDGKGTRYLVFRGNPKEALETAERVLWGLRLYVAGKRGHA